MEGERSHPRPSQIPKAKFFVYQNPNFAATLTATARSLQPSPSALLISSSFASAFSLIAITSRSCFPPSHPSLSLSHNSLTIFFLLFSSGRIASSRALHGSMFPSARLISSLSLRTIFPCSPSVRKNSFSFNMHRRILYQGLGSCNRPGVGGDSIGPYQDTVAPQHKKCSDRRCSFFISCIPFEETEGADEPSDQTIARVLGLEV